MYEKRSYTRFIINGSANIRTEGDALNLFKGELIDVGFKGFSAYLKEKIELNSIVQFELTTDLMSRPLSGKGKIRNVVESKRRGAKYFKVGIEFIDTDKDSIEILLAQIHHRISREKRKRAESRGSNIGPY
jgi:hypothetical protein